MRLILSTLVAMIAFAANSVLNRWAVADLGTDPATFAAVRVAAGAGVLLGLMWLRGIGWPRGGARRICGVLSLAAYMVGFSAAYRVLDAGFGALILFGVVQLTMFAGAAVAAEPPGPRKIAGAGVALAGLAVLVWPAGPVTAPAGGVAAMVAAGIGWGVYSLSGRRETAPLAATGANFVLCLPLVLVPLVWTGVSATAGGIVVAALAGGVTSGLGYALWYRVVPRLGASVAGIAQLCVPVIAALGGALFLGEAVGMRFVVAAALVLGGIALSLGRAA